MMSARLFCYAGGMSGQESVQNGTISKRAVQMRSGSMKGEAVHG